MANRLSVVIVQSSGDRPERQQVEEQLLVQLMAARGLDPVLVRSADQWTADRTDLLPLQAAQAELIVCAWADPRETRATLEQFGISTRRDAGSTSDSSTGERIRLFDLREVRSVADLVADCLELLRASQTSVVQIGLPGQERAPVPERSASRRTPAARSTEDREPPAPSPRQATGERRHDAELERLVDQLNDEMW